MQSLSKWHLYLPILVYWKPSGDANILLPIDATIRLFQHSSPFRVVEYDETPGFRVSMFRLWRTWLHYEVLPLPRIPSRPYWVWLFDLGRVHLIRRTQVGSIRCDVGLVVLDLHDGERSKRCVQQCSVHSWRYCSDQVFFNLCANEAKLRRIACQFLLVVFVRNGAITASAVNFL